MDWDQIGKWGKIMLSLFPWILVFFGVHNFTYNKSPKYYFWILNKTKKLRNTTWNLNARFIIDISIDDFHAMIEKIMRERYKNHFKKEVNFKSKKVWRCGYSNLSFNLIITDDFDLGTNSDQQVFFSISQLNVTLDRAEVFLREFRELFNNLERNIKPEKTSYNLDVFFPENKNPFYGLMIQRMGTHNIEHFECRFPISALVSKDHESSEKKNYLRVYKEKICINESSFDILEETALRALLLR
jgi:hypothetical protein